jgi:hypothetical protein
MRQPKYVFYTTFCISSANVILPVPVYRAMCAVTAVSWQPLLETRVTEKYEAVFPVS